MFSSNGHTGSMIALVVPDPENYALTPQSGNEVPADELHITLGYLGEAADIGPEERQAILDAVQVLADTADAPEALFPATTGVFPPADPDENGSDTSVHVPYYAAPANPERFGALREDLLVHLSARGVSSLVSTKHPVFSPHVTLSYEPLDAPPDLSGLPTPLPTRFHTIVVTFGDETHFFELGQPAEGPELPLTASARDYLHRLATRTETAEDYLTAIYLRQRQVRSTPAATRAQQALNITASLADPHYRSQQFHRIQTLSERARTDVLPASRLFAANRALALAAQTPTPHSPTEARELQAITASLRAIIADGNSSIARSLRARKQLRDRYGRWIEMGGGARFKVRSKGAPGGGTWFHGKVVGFDVPNGKVHVELEDGKVVAVPNTKLEQPKAILNMGLGKAVQKAKTFVPKSAGRKGKASTSKDFDPNKDAADKAQDDAAVEAMDRIQKDLAVVYDDATVSGGNIAPLVNDPALKNKEQSDRDAGETSTSFVPTKKPAGTAKKDAEVSLDHADIDVVRASLDRLTVDYSPSQEELDALPEDQQKKALQTARSKAYGRLATLYNERGADQELLRAPSVGTEDELEEVSATPDGPELAPIAETTPEEVQEGIKQAIAELIAAVPDNHSLSAARDKITSSIEALMAGHQDGSVSDEEMLHGLDLIKEYANAQEPGYGKTSPEQQAFGQFAEDIDNLHASIGGTDDVDKATSATLSVESLMESQGQAEADDGKPLGLTDEQEATRQSAWYVHDRVTKGEYLGENQKKLLADLTELREELANTEINDEESKNEVLAELDAAIADVSAPGQPGEDLSDVPDAPEAGPDPEQAPEATPAAETPSVEPDPAPEAPAAPEFKDSPLLEAVKNGDSFLLDEADVPGDPADYTDAPEDADAQTKAKWDAYSDAAGALADLTIDENGSWITPDSAEGKEALNVYNNLLSDVYSGNYWTEQGGDISKAGEDLYEALQAEGKYDEGQLNAFREASEIFAVAVLDAGGTGPGPDAPEDGTEIPSELVDPGIEEAPVGSGLQEFFDLSQQITDLEGEWPADEALSKKLNEAATEIANIGKNFDQGFIDTEDANDFISNIISDLDVFSDDTNDDYTTWLTEDPESEHLGDQLSDILSQLGQLQAKVANGELTPTNAQPEVDPKALEIAATQFDDWLLNKAMDITEEPDFESGQGADWTEPVSAPGDFETFRAKVEEALNDHSDGNLSSEDLVKTLDEAAAEWVASPGFTEMTGWDEDGGAQEDWSGTEQIDAVKEALGLTTPTSSQADDPWAEVSTTAQDEAAKMPVEELIAKHAARASEAHKNAQDALEQLAAEPDEETLKDAENALNLFADELEAAQAESTGLDQDDFIVGAQQQTDDMSEDLEALAKKLGVDVPKKVDPNSIQGAINQLEEQGSPLSKVLGSYLQDKLDNNEPITEDDITAIKQLLDTWQSSDENTPEEKADLTNAIDALDAAPVEEEEEEEEEAEAEAEAEAPEADASDAGSGEPPVSSLGTANEDEEEPSEDGHNAKDALAKEAALEAWKKSLDEYNEKNKGGSGVTIVKGSAHNELGSKQLANLEDIIDNLPAEVGEPLEKMLGKHVAKTVSDDDLLQAITEALFDTHNASLRGRLRGAQQGIQKNKGALVPILRPKNKLYTKLGLANDFYLAAPGEVKATLKSILKQAASGADFADLEGDEGTNAQVRDKIKSAAEQLQDALNAMDAGDVDGMVGSMRIALDEYEDAINLRKGIHKHDKVVRRLRARRRALDEVLAGFEGRWPDPKIMGNPQGWEPGTDYKADRSHKDREGNDVYPGDRIKRVVGGTKGQTGLVLGWRTPTDKTKQFGAHLWLDQEKEERPQGVTQKSFVLDAVGPNNPLYHDPSYTGPKVEPDLVDEFTPIHEKKFEKQEKKAAKKEAEASALSTPGSTGISKEEKEANAQPFLDALDNPEITKEEVESIVDQVQAQGTEPLGVKGFNQAMKKADNKYKDLTGDSITKYLSDNSDEEPAGSTWTGQLNDATSKEDVASIMGDVSEAYANGAITKGLYEALNALANEKFAELPQESSSDGDVYGSYLDDISTAGSEAALDIISDSITDAEQSGLITADQATQLRMVLDDKYSIISDYGDEDLGPQFEDYSYPEFFDAVSITEDTAELYDLHEQIKSAPNMTEEERQDLLNMVASKIANNTEDEEGDEWADVPFGQNLAGDPDLIEKLKALPVGVKVRTPSTSVGLDFDVWTKADDGGWYNQAGDGMVVQYFEDESFDIIQVLNPDGTLPVGADEEGPFQAVVNAQIANASSIGDLEQLSQHINDLFNAGELSEIGYSNAMGKVNAKKLDFQGFQEPGVVSMHASAEHVLPDGYPQPPKGSTVHFQSKQNTLGNEKWGKDYVVEHPDGTFHAYSKYPPNNWKFIEELQSLEALSSNSLLEPFTPAPKTNLLHVLPESLTGESGDSYTGGRHWGLYGAAGIAMTYTDPNTGEKFVLLGKRGDKENDQGAWYLPGGALDEKESPIQGATREFHEEVLDGAQLTEGLSVANEHQYVDAEDGNWTYTTLEVPVTSVTEVTAPPDAPPYEFVEFMWLNAEQLAQLDNEGKLHKQLSSGKFAEQMGMQAPVAPDAVPEPAPASTAEDHTDAPGFSDDLSAVVYVMDDWAKSSSGLGSQTSFIVTAPDGTKYYAKRPKTDQHVHTEVLAAALYKAFGVPHADQRIGTIGDVKYVVAPWIDGDQSAVQKALNTGNNEFLDKIRADFAIDAFLGNYDTIGPGKQNIIADADGNPVHIDAGASLFYRGTGGTKSWWGPDPVELDDMRKGSGKSGSYSSAAAVFGKMTDDDVKESATKLLSMSPKQIEDMVNSTGLSKAKKTELISTLIKRRHKILEKYGLLNSEANVSKSTTDHTIKVAEEGQAVQSIQSAASAGPITVGDKVAWSFDAALGVQTGTTLGPAGAGWNVMADNGTIVYVPSSMLTKQSLPEEGTEVVKPTSDIALIHNGHVFKFDDPVMYPSGPNQWSPATIGAISTAHSGHVAVTDSEDGGQYFVPFDQVLTPEAYAALGDTSKIGNPPTTTQAVSLGDGFPAVPAGAQVLKKREFPNGDSNVLVKHEDGEYWIYTSKGAASKSYKQNPFSYKPENGWFDFQVTTPSVVDAQSGADLGPGYVVAPPGSKALFKQSDGALHPAYIVQHEDGSLHMYHHEVVSNATGIGSEELPSSWSIGDFELNDGWENLEGLSEVGPNLLAPADESDLPAAALSTPNDGSSTFWTLGDGKAGIKGSLVKVTKYSQGSEPIFGKIVGWNKQTEGLRIMVTDFAGNPILNPKTGKNWYRSFKPENLSFAGAEEVEAPEAPKTPPSNTPVVQPKNAGLPTGISLTAPDTSNPLFNTPMPQPPEAPEVVAGDMVDDEWMKRADDAYQVRKKKTEPDSTKTLAQSSYANTYYAQIKQGDKSALDYLNNKGYFESDPELYTEAAAMIDAHAAKLADAIAAHQVKLDEHNDLLSEWMKANGKAVYTPLDPKTVSWKKSHGAAHTAMLEAFKSKYAKLSQKAKSALSNQKGSSSWQSQIRLLSKVLGLDRETVAKHATSYQMDIWDGMAEMAEESGPVGFAWKGIRTVTVNRFADSNGVTLDGNADLTQIIGTIQKDHGAMEFTPGDLNNGGKPGYNSGPVLVDLTVPPEIKGFYTPAGQFSHAGEHGFIAEPGLAMYIWDVKPTTGTQWAGGYKWIVSASLIPTDVLPFMNNFTGGPAAHPIVLPGKNDGTEKSVNDGTVKSKNDGSAQNTYDGTAKSDNDGSA